MARAGRAAVSVSLPGRLRVLAAETVGRPWPADRLARGLCRFHRVADVKVVHAPGLGAERHNGAAWRKSASALHSMDGRLDRFLSAPPKWRLHVVHPGDGEDCVPDRLRQRPTASGPFRVAAPEHRPFDWTTLELLLSEAMAHGEERAKAFAHSARERTARLKPPPERLTTALRDILVTSDQLTKALQAFRAGQPFLLEGWLSHADLIVRIMLLEDGSIPGSQDTASKASCSACRSSWSTTRVSCAA